MKTANNISTKATTTMTTTNTTANATIKSIAIGLPKTVRTNEWFIENHPDVYAAIEQKVLAQVFKDRGDDANTQAWDAPMKKYLADPFRGTVNRRILDENVDMIAFEADVAKEAINAAKLAVEDIDMILASSFPSAEVGLGDGVFIARALGTKRPAFNVETTCSSALASLQLAAAMVSSGQANNVLVVVSCIYSRCCDWSDTLTWFLGDAVGAYVVSRANADSDVDGEGFRAFHAVNTAESCGSFAYHIENDRRVIRAGADGGRALRNITPTSIKACVGALAREGGVALEDIDAFVPNSPTAWMAETFATTLGVPVAKVTSTYEQYANVGPALSAVNLYSGLQGGTIERGDDVVLFTIGSVSSAASALIRVGDVALGAIVER